jgi:hypothetical protein
MRRLRWVDVAVVLSIVLASYLCIAVYAWHWRNPRSGNEATPMWSILTFQRVDRYQNVRRLVPEPRREGASVETP